MCESSVAGVVGWLSVYYWLIISSVVKVVIFFVLFYCFFFQAEDGIRDCLLSRGLGDVYKRQDYQGI